MQLERSHSAVSNGITRQKLWELLGTACIFLFAPLIVITLILLYIYRRLIETVLRIQLRGKFAGLLKGTDCVWAIEDTVSLSVINILMVLERTAQSSNAIFLEDFRNLINDRIASKAAGTTLEKLFYRRSRKYGYYFWERSEEVDLRDRIRWLECANASCDGSCEDASGESFRRTLENVCNRPLPDDHAAAWEVLVGRRCPRSGSHVEEGRPSPEECFNTDARKIPILFRVHHSLGDGVALLGLLLKAIVEEDEAKETRVKIKSVTSAGETGERYEGIVPPSRDSERNFRNGREVVRFYERDILAASMPFTCVTFSRILRELRDHFRASLKFSNSVTIESLKQQAKISIDRTWSDLKDIVLKRIYARIKGIMRLTMILLLLPKFLIQQAVRSMDENALHGPPLTGEKIVSYWLERDVTDSKSPNLLTKIREIRKNTGAKFGDIVLAAFSSSIHKYHLRVNKPAPDALTAILPMRMAMPDDNVTLDNKFSIALMRVCISDVNGRTTITQPNLGDSPFFKRLQDITRASNELRKGPDVVLNFWVMKYLSALLPVMILRAFLLSHSTMAFSNMCGPQKVRILNNPLSNITFWIPNKSTTALGFSLLSYGGNLHLSLMADRSVIKDERPFMELLEDTVHEIDTAYNSIALTCLSKSSGFPPVERPTKKGIGVLK